MCKYHEYTESYKYLCSWHCMLTLLTYVSIRHWLGNTVEEDCKTMCGETFLSHVWLTMSVGSYIISKSAQEKQTNILQRKLCLFLYQNSPCNLSQINSLRPSPRIKQNSWYILSVAAGTPSVPKRFPCLERLRPTFSPYFSSFSSAILKFHIQNILTTPYSLPQKAFIAVVQESRIREITTSWHHSLTTGQVERFNHTVRWRLQNYVSNYQSDEGNILLPLTYAYNVQGNRTTKLSTISVVLRRQPPGPALPRN